MQLIEKFLKIEQLKTEIEAFGEFDLETKQKINYKFRLDWNYYSNSMEGNTLTMDETRSVMVGNLTVGGKPIKDVIEMNGHDEVVKEIIQFGKGESRLSEKRIKQIHTAIMHEEDEAKKKEIGQWKTHGNHIINYKGEKHQFALPLEVPELMHELLNDTNAGLDAISLSKKQAPNPVELAFKFHCNYLSIHPFYDGNGRTARILTNLILISQGYPPLIIRTEDKNAYYRYLSDVQTYGGKPDLFFGFMADLLIRSQEIVLKALKGEDIEELDDIDKKIQLLEKKTLVQSRLNKSPKVVYQTFKHFEDKIWPAFNQTLNKFNNFFSDNPPSIHFVNDMEEIFETTTKNLLSPFLVEKSGKPKEIKIFGHNVYDGVTDITSFEWHIIKYGLKTPQKVVNFEFILRVKCDIENYTWTISSNGKQIINDTQSYRMLLSNEKIAKMMQELKKAIYHEIETKTSN